MRLRLRRLGIGFRCPVRLDTKHDPQRQPVKAAAAATAAAATLRQPLGSFSGSFFFLPSKAARESGSAPGENRDLPHTGRWGESGRVPWRGRHVVGWKWENGTCEKKGHVEVPFSPGSPSVSIARHVNTGLGTESCTGDGGSETAD